MRQAPPDTPEAAALLQESFNQAPEQAIASLHRLLKQQPSHGPALLRLGQLEQAQGQWAAAAAHLSSAALLAPDQPLILGPLAGAQARAGQLHAALCTLTRLVKLQPDNGGALHLLAALHGSLGLNTLSRHWAERAAQVRPLASHRAAQTPPRLRVLHLQSLTAGRYAYTPSTGELALNEGHNNLGGLLDPQAIERHVFSVEAVASPAGRAEWLRRLPPVDLVLNGITVPERGAAALHAAEALCRALGRPVFNPPAAVLACTREHNAARLQAFPELRLPRSLALGELVGDIAPLLRQTLAEHALHAPVILRAGGFQGGRHMYLVTEPDQLKVSLPHPTPVYLIEYQDVSFSDPRAPGVRFYPKYRAMKVGAELFAVHLFVAANDFNVHHKNAAPTHARYPWLLERERAYLADPAAHLGAAAWAALDAALGSLGLDYVGVDFAPLAPAAGDPQPSPQLVVFEANPAMRNWIKQLPETDPVQHAWVAVTRAVHRQLCQRAGVAPWTFDLPSPGRGATSPPAANPDPPQSEPLA